MSRTTGRLDDQRGDRRGVRRGRRWCPKEVRVPVAVDVASRREERRVRAVDRGDLRHVTHLGLVEPAPFLVEVNGDRVPANWKSSGNRVMPQKSHRRDRLAAPGGSVDPTPTARSWNLALAGAVDHDVSFRRRAGPSFTLAMTIW